MKFCQSCAFSLSAELNSVKALVVYRLVLLKLADYITVHKMT